MTLEELETRMKATRYQREPPTRHDEIEADMRATVLKLLAVAVAARKMMPQGGYVMVPSDTRHYMIPNREVQEVLEALRALKS